MRASGGVTGAAQAGADLVVQSEHPQLHGRVTVGQGLAQVPGQPTRSRGLFLALLPPTFLPARHQHGRHREHRDQEQQGIEPREDQQRADTAADLDRDHQQLVVGGDEPAMGATNQLELVLVVGAFVVFDPGDGRRHGSDLLVERERHPLAEPVRIPQLTIPATLVAHWMTATRAIPTAT